MTMAPERLIASQQDIDGVTEAVLAYYEGYLQGDPERHSRAYHPECVKRRLYLKEDSGVWELDTLSPQVMVDYAATGTTVDEDCEFEVIIDDISEDIASVRVYSTNWVDFIHLSKARGEWRLFHVTWHNRKKEG